MLRSPSTGAHFSPMPLPYRCGSRPSTHSWCKGSLLL
jgi:hypothetical protein